MKIPKRVKFSIAAVSVIVALTIWWMERIATHKELDQSLQRLYAAEETLQTTQMLASRSSNQLQVLRESLSAPNSSKKLHTAKATITAYSPLDDQNGINSQGSPTSTSIGAGVTYGIFAVDPARIPYGSNILIIYPDGTTEQGIAADTGGALRDARGIAIDVFRDTFAQAIAFGRKDATVVWQPPEN